MALRWFNFPSSSLLKRHLQRAVQTSGTIENKKNDTQRLIYCVHFILIIVASKYNYCCYIKTKKNKTNFKVSI